jgi:hypothetical protein
VERLGLHAFGFKGAMETLWRLHEPAILQFRAPKGQSHFVVFLGWSGRDGGWTIFDPPGTILRMKDKQLNDLFTGVGLVVSDKELPSEGAFLVEPSCWWLWTGLELSAIGIALVASGVWRWRRAARGASTTGFGVTIVALVCLIFGGSCAREGNDRSSSDATDSGQMNTIDVGTVIKGAELKARFEVVNRSDAPFRIIRVDRSCLCQTVGADIGRVIGFGERFYVSVTVPTAGLSGDVTKQFTVVTDSKAVDYAEVPLTLRGRVRVPIAATPSRIVFGKTDGATSVNRFLTVTTDPASLTDGYTGAFANNPGLYIALTSQKPGWLAFEIGFTPLCPAGDLTSELEVRFSDVHFSKLVVPVVGTKTGGLEIIPPQLTLPAKHLLEPFISRFRVSSRRGEAFAIVGGKVPPGIEVDWGTASGLATSHEFSAQISKKASEEPLKARAILVKTSLANEMDLRIPIVFR